MSKQYRCESCDQPITARRFRQFKICSKHRCRVAANRRRSLQEQERYHEQRATLLRSFRSLADQTRESLNLELKPDTMFVIAPANLDQCTELPARRIQDFRERMLVEIRRAVECRVEFPASGETANLPGEAPASDQDTSAESRRSKVLRHACALCAGHCCRRGSNHAYIKSETIQRVMRDNPGMRPGEVMDAYVSFLPSQTYENSCVYHTRDGCALPVPLRSDLCNRYFCSPLQEFRERTNDSELGQVFLAAAEDDRLVRAELIDEHQTQRISHSTICELADEAEQS